MGKWSFAKPEVLVSVPAGVSSTEEKGGGGSRHKSRSQSGLRDERADFGAPSAQEFPSRADRAYDC